MPGPLRPAYFVSFGSHRESSGSRGANSSYFRRLTGRFSSWLQAAKISKWWPLQRVITSVPASFPWNHPLTFVCFCNNLDFSRLRVGDGHSQVCLGTWTTFCPPQGHAQICSNFELVFVSRIPQIRLKKSVTEILLRRFCDRNSHTL